MRNNRRHPNDMRPRRNEALKPDLFERLDYATARTARNILDEIEKMRNSENPLSDIELPIDSKMEYIKSLISENDITLIEAETGAGKSINIPQWVYEIVRKEVFEEANDKKDARIAVVQPRRDAAQTNAQNLAARNNIEFGSDVCFSTSEFKGNDKDTKIQVQTAGLLLHRFKRDPKMKYYDALVIDEAHERNMDYDMLFGLVKIANEKRVEDGMKPLKVILTSATADTTVLRDYFDIPSDAYEQVEGRTYPVEMNHATEDEVVYTRSRKGRGNGVERNSISTAGNKVLDILEQTQQGDVLVFLPGIAAIRKLEVGLQRNNANADIHIMHSSESTASRSETLRGSSGGRRRIILSTNIAETSVTVPNIKYVVDTCTRKRKVFDPKIGLEFLVEVEVSQAEAKQRAGRAGRTENGEYYSTVTTEEFEELEEHPAPDIQKLSIDGVILRLASFGVKNIREFPFVTKPPEENIKAAISRLQRLEALDENMELTETGRLMERIPAEPRMAKMILESQEYGCVKQSVSIAIMSEMNVFAMPSRNDIERQMRNDGVQRENEEGVKNARSAVLKRFSNIRKERLGNLTSEWEQYWYLMEKYKSVTNKEQFCREYCLNASTMKKALKNIQKTEKELRRNGIESTESPSLQQMTNAIIKAYAPEQLMIRSVVRGRSGDNYGHFRQVNTGAGRFFIASSSEEVDRKNSEGEHIHDLFIPLSLSQDKDGINNFVSALHPVRPETLLRSVPHLMRKTGKASCRFSEQEMEVKSIYDSYEFLNQNGKWVELDIKDSVSERSPEATLEFARALLGNEKLVKKYGLEILLKLNEELKSYVQRSLGGMEWKGMYKWLAEKLGTAFSLYDLPMLLRKNPQLFDSNIDNICPKDEREEIERSAPLEIKTENGMVFDIKYVYSETDVTGDTQKVTITLNKDKHPINSFEAVKNLYNAVQNFDEQFLIQQIPILGDVDIDKVLRYDLSFSGPWNNGMKVDAYERHTNIEEIKTSLKKEVFKAAEYDFFDETTTDQSIDWEKNISELGSVDNFPTLESLGAIDIEICDIDGEKLIAYPVFNYDIVEEILEVAYTTDKKEKENDEKNYETIKEFLRISAEFNGESETIERENINMIRFIKSKLNILLHSDYQILNNLGDYLKRKYQFDYPIKSIFDEDESYRILEMNFEDEDEDVLLQRMLLLRSIMDDFKNDIEIIDIIDKQKNIVDDVSNKINELDDEIGLAVGISHNLCMSIKNPIEALKNRWFANWLKNEPKNEEITKENLERDVAELVGKFEYINIPEHIEYIRELYAQSERTGMSMIVEHLGSSIVEINDLYRLRVEKHIKNTENVLLSSQLGSWGQKQYDGLRLSGSDGNKFLLVDDYNNNSRQYEHSFKLPKERGTYAISYIACDGDKKAECRVYKCRLREINKHGYDEKVLVEPYELIDVVDLGSGVDVEDRVANTKSYYEESAIALSGRKILKAIEQRPLVTMESLDGKKEFKCTECGATNKLTKSQFRQYNDGDDVSIDCGGSCGGTAKVRKEDVPTFEAKKVESVIDVEDFSTRINVGDLMKRFGGEVEEDQDAYVYEPPKKEPKQKRTDYEIERNKEHQERAQELIGEEDKQMLLEQLEHIKALAKIYKKYGKQHKVQSGGAEKRGREDKRARGKDSGTKKKASKPKKPRKLTEREKNENKLFDQNRKLQESIAKAIETLQTGNIEFARAVSLMAELTRNFTVGSFHNRMESIIPGYQRGGIDRFNTDWDDGLGEVIYLSEDAKEYINEGMTTRDDLLKISRRLLDTKVEEYLHKGFVDLAGIVEEALGEIE
jgi:HrpA-like RNA helicase